MTNCYFLEKQNNNPQTFAIFVHCKNDEIYINIIRKSRKQIKQYEYHWDVSSANIVIYYMFFFLFFAFWVYHTETHTKQATLITSQKNIPILFRDEKKELFKKIFFHHLYVYMWISVLKKVLVKPIKRKRIFTFFTTNVRLCVCVCYTPLTNKTKHFPTNLFSEWSLYFSHSYYWVCLWNRSQYDNKQQQKSSWGWRYSICIYCIW